MDFGDPHELPKNPLEGPPGYADPPISTWGGPPEVSNPQKGLSAIRSISLVQVTKTRPTLPTLSPSEFRNWSTHVWNTVGSNLARKGRVPRRAASVPRPWGVSVPRRAASVPRRAAACRGVPRAPKCVPRRAAACRENRRPACRERAASVPRKLRKGSSGPIQDLASFAPQSGHPRKLFEIMLRTFNRSSQLRSRRARDILYCSKLNGLQPGWQAREKGIRNADVWPWTTFSCRQAPHRNSTQRSRSGKQLQRSTVNLSLEFMAGQKA